MNSLLFKAEMIRAIQRDLKTQTRRVINLDLDNRGLRYCNEKTGWEDWHGNPVKCPYGKPGDERWVRENFWCWGKWQDYLDGEKKRQRFVDMTYEERPVRYVADNETFSMGNYLYGVGYHKRPSIYMPRKYSRISVRVIDIRVERIQDITEQDAISEGAESGWSGLKNPYKSGFAELWDSINEKRGYGWYENPWVWVVDFERITI